MTLDQYAPCPCGSGKKIKFCCSHDISADLDKVVRALEGDQRVGALDQISRLLVSKGPRAALLCLKGSILISQGEFEKAQAATDEFLQVAPGNPAALSQASILAAAKGNMEGSIEALHQALSAQVEVLPMELLQAVEVVVRRFVATGNVIAARAHLLLLLGISPEEDDNPWAMQTLMSINQGQDVPLLLKQDTPFAKAPDNVPWKGEFDAALHLVHKGNWVSACEKFVGLAGQDAPHSSILKNIAILQGWLGNVPVSTTAWHAYSEQDDVAQDDAVEAEALAQLLDPDTYSDKIDDVRIVYTVKDTEKLMERLLSDKRVSRMPIDTAELADEGEPPPKAAFWLQDRPTPSSGAELTRNNVPSIMAELLIYGRQTDREARLEFMATRSANFVAKTDLLKEVTGELLAGIEKEETLKQVSATVDAITWRWRLPQDTPEDLRQDLISQQRREVLFEGWPNLPLPVLDGKTPRQVAADPTYRTRLLAAILLLELSGDQQRWNLDFNELRKKLGLPTRDPIAGKELDIEKVSLINLPLVEPAQISDEPLLRGLNRCLMHGEFRGAKNFADEVLRRESFKASPVRINAYDVLSRTAIKFDDAVAYLRKARDVAEELKRSPAPQLLAELELQLARGSAQDATQLLDRIQKRHIREPGVAQRLYSTLVRFGVINQDGSPANVPPAAMPAAAPPSAAALWTPDAPSTPQPAVAASAAGEKSKLWLPGMD